jgi:HEAT repeat protein
VRRSAASALHAFPQESARVVPALVKALKDKDADVREWAAWSLGELGKVAKGSIPALIEALRDENAFVQVNAAESLWRIARHKDSLPTLIRALRHEKDGVVRRAAYALAEMGPEAKAAVPALRRALKNASQDTRSVIAKSLKKIETEKPSPRH